LKAGLSVATVSVPGATRFRESFEHDTAPVDPDAPLVPVEPPEVTAGLSFAHAARIKPKAATAVMNLRIFEPPGSTLTGRGLAHRGRA
jgi:hypothetical protein